MKNRIRISSEQLQEVVNFAAGKAGSAEKVVVNIEDETGKIIRTVAGSLAYDDDLGEYSLEWIP